MARSTIRVTNDKGFGGYYGNLRKWEGLATKDLAWKREELTGVNPMEDPDFWIDEYTTQAEIDYRNRAHRAKFN